MRIEKLNIVEFVCWNEKIVFFSVKKDSNIESCSNYNKDTKSVIALAHAQADFPTSGWNINYSLSAH